MAMKKLTVTGTGDSLFLQEFPQEYDSAIRKVADFINSCDVKITNLETNFSDFEYFPGAYSGGTWLNTRRECLPSLLRFGFNCFGTANNHCFDYSYNGLLSTIEFRTGKNSLPATHTTPDSATLFRLLDEILRSSAA